MKKWFMLLPVLAAAVLVAGGCLTVSAASDTPDYKSVIDTMTTYANRNNVTMYTYQVLVSAPSNFINNETGTRYNLITCTAPLRLRPGWWVMYDKESYPDASYSIVCYKSDGTCYTGRNPQNPNIDSILWYVNSSSEVSVNNFVYATNSDLLEMNYDSEQKKFVPINRKHFSSTPDFFPKPSPLVTAAKQIPEGAVMMEVVYLIPLLIPCLAGYLALRKALSFISQTLNAA